MKNLKQLYRMLYNIQSSINPSDAMLVKINNHKTATIKTASFVWKYRVKPAVNDFFEKVDK